MELTLKLDRGLSGAYSSCREFVAARVHQQPRQQKEIAADMDYSPSDLSRKLAQNPDDTRRFTLDDLERYIAVTGDTDPVLYLAEKFLGPATDEIAALEKRLAELRKQQVRGVGA